MLEGNTRAGIIQYNWVRCEVEWIKSLNLLREVKLTNIRFDSPVYKQSGK